MRTNTKRNENKLIEESLERDVPHPQTGGSGSIIDQEFLKFAANMNQAFGVRADTADTKITVNIMNNNSRQEMINGGPSPTKSHTVR